MKITTNKLLPLLAALSVASFSATAQNAPDGRTGSTGQTTQMDRTGQTGQVGQTGQLGEAGQTGQAGQTDSNALPPEKKFGSVSYVTGGIPDAQATAFKAARSDYPLAIEVYQKAGAKSEYTADAEITVTDRKGLDVLVAKADGPFLFAELPAGTYNVKAVLEGKTVQKKGVQVGKNGSTRAVLVFPQGTD